VTLRERLVGMIRREGPISVSRFMSLCLHDAEAGYYATRPEFGAEGDFLTAPMVSQIFGELLGLWAAEVWAGLGRPSRVQLVELGPGLGLMMADALRAARVANGFLESAEIWLVELSEPLRRRQAETLRGVASPRWIPRLEDLPADGPVIMLANEFLDCLPIDQAVRTATAWRERRVAVDGAGALVFALGSEVDRPLPPGPASAGDVAEWSDALESFGGAVGALIARRGGGALFIDYGRAEAGFGDTLQAVRRHRKESPLCCPGEADLTAHVDFPGFLAAARAAGARTPPARTQRALLGSLGVEARALALARARPDRAAPIGRQLDRLTAPDQMGHLFKAAVVHAEGLAIPGFQPV
jgi:NADH dehydrogenase [ubiquinone] 1 alpha subcomplex assembly factor 7